MNKKLVIVLVVVTLGILSLAYLVFVAGDTAKAPMAPAENSQSAAPSSNEQTAPTDTGQYVTYEHGIIESTEGNKVLFFHAPWCPQCRAIESDINQQGAPDDWTIIKVDYDSNQALRQKYGVTIQTTFVKVNDEGEFVSKHVAYNEPSLDAVTRDYLN